MAYTLRYAEELRDAKDYFGGIQEQHDRQKATGARQRFIRAQSAPFHLGDFKDDYEAALRELIEAKRTEKPLPVAEGKPRAKVINLMDALKRSVTRVQPSATKHPKDLPRSHSSKNGPTLVKSRKRSHKAA